ncbi:MAG: MATE family efflux transporter [Sphaerochaetaceae bacterium]
MNEDTSKILVTDFTEGPITKQLIWFASPLFLSNLLQILYNMVDMIVVGQVVGKAGLSAVSIGGDITTFLTFLAMGFSTAGQIIIAQFIGARQNSKVGPFIGTMVCFLMGFSLCMSLACLLIRTQLLHWMNTPEEAWTYTLAYTTTTITGLVFIYGYNMVSAILRGLGDSKHPFVFVSIAALLNIVLDLLFVAGLGMGPFGAALATIIGQAVSFLWAVGFLYTKRKSLGFSLGKRDFSIRKEYLLQLVRLGVPMAIKSAAIMFSKLFVNSWINGYGVVVSAVAGIGNKFNSISNLFSNSMNNAGSSMIAQNIGATKYHRVPKIMGIVFVINVLISLILTSAILLFPKEIFGIFSADASIMGVAMEYIPVAVCIFLGSAFRSPMNALINGSGNYKVNFAVALLDRIIMRIGLALLLGLVWDFGYLGFWFGDAIAGFTPFFIGIVFYLTGTWKTRNYVIKE